MRAIRVLTSVCLLVLFVATSLAGEVEHSSLRQDSLLQTARKYPFRLKANLLYWAAATPNVSAELHLSPRLSLSTEVTFAWWSHKSSSFYWQLVAVSPELRYWFSTDRPFKGHYAGVYAAGGLYDVMFKPLTADKGYQGSFYAAGLSYGYQFPIAKRLSLEVGIGIGYLSTGYRQYVCGCSDYMRTDTKRTTWIGPTKLNITLVWQLSR